VKFGGRFRLFFRYDGRARLIVFAWVNDEQTLRKCGAKSDAPLAPSVAMIEDAPERRNAAEAAE